ncbi:MAG: PAS domain-containing protein [Burkholderiaceae bacterium]|nr:MAG: PAS domain-containing protein [Burkholderiaceae bacterium]
MQLYKRIFEATPDGMLVVGRDGVVIDANAQASAMFGYAALSRSRHAMRPE